MGILQNVLETVVTASCSDKGQAAIKAAKTTTKIVVVVALNVFAYLDENYRHSGEAAPF